MFRRVYSFLLRLHPRAFRERFSDEMLSIFDDSPEKGPLLFDAGASLLRQKLLRESDSEAPPTAPVSDGVPLFRVIDDAPPRTSALLQGALLSLALIAIVVGGGGSRGSLLIGTRQPRTEALPVDRNSIAGATPTTKVNVAQKPPDPWHAFAVDYFRLMPVLRALDQNHDYFLSRAEIANASAALLSLDADHDGALSALECGAQSDAPMLAFMRAQPVLAALDADHDGEISAAEIAHATAALRMLDVSGDGALDPAEIAPDSVVVRILGQERAR